MATVFPRFKDQILYHRTFIPGKLQPYFRGRSQLWRSLRTSDRELAVIRSAQWTVRMNRLFLTLKRHGYKVAADVIRKYIRFHEAKKRGVEQLDLF